MTREEIKEQISMRDVIGRYGLMPTRSGFIRCPFHSGDHQASLKVYDKDFHCFGCGANGDIFTFVQMMEGISFKEAFRLLGGSYEKPSFSTRLAIYRHRKNREMRKKEEDRRRSRKQLNILLISVYQKWLGRLEPLSDGWCDCFNKLQYQLYLHDIMNRGDKDGADGKPDKQQYPGRKDF